MNKLEIVETELLAGAALSNNNSSLSCLRGNLVQCCLSLPILLLLNNYSTLKIFFQRYELKISINIIVLKI